MTSPIVASTPELAAALTAEPAIQQVPVLRFDGEHGIFAAPGGSPLRVGDSPALVPGYSPTTVNWYDAYHVVRDDVVADIWPVIREVPATTG
jgi:D-serine deaminase-like pyridoxal phosphate-dependent protein